jgi:hypothetical protein
MAAQNGGRAWATLDSDKATAVNRRKDRGRPRVDGGVGGSKPVEGGGEGGGRVGGAGDAGGWGGGAGGGAPGGGCAAAAALLRIGIQPKRLPLLKHYCCIIYEKGSAHENLIHFCNKIHKSLSGNPLS